MNYPCQALIVASSCRDFDVALGGFALLFRIPHSPFRIGPMVFAISSPNTTRLPRLPRGGLGALWYHLVSSYTHRTLQKLPFRSGKLIQVDFVNLPEQTSAWQPELQHWAGLSTSGRADRFEETLLLRLVRIARGLRDRRARAH